VVLAACGDPDVAEDAADEAFARALLHKNVQAMASPEAWVCQVAINVMRRRLRRRAVEARLLGRQWRPIDAEPRIPYPEVWASVRDLPERQRLAIVLRYVGDLPEGDIASIMGVTRGSVAASLAAARERLAVSLKGFAVDTGLNQECPNG
jgi:RNA polymerase sigma-70 factor (ECF subfamily)